MGKPQYSQRFRSEWLNDERYKQWLMRLEGCDTKCYCKYCKVELLARLGDIERHSKTKKHVRAAEPFSSSRQRALPFKPIRQESKLVEGRLALFIAEHCSFLTVDHLCDLCKSCFSDSKGTVDLKLHRTKCTAIACNVLAPHFEQFLISDLGDQGYSLIVDETNDISVTKLLGIVIRYYSTARNTIVNTYLEVAQLDECNADSIVESLKSCLSKRGLNVNKLLAIGTDNASVMVGINNGVYAKLKSEIPHLQLIRCVCHSLQLAVSHAASEFLPRNLEFLIKETYNWFSHSALRQITYKELFATINDGDLPLKLVQMSQTRWLSIESAVTRILQQWLELKTHFEISRLRDRCYTADLLFSMYNDETNYLYLIFLKPVLQEVQRVNKKFESKSQDPTKLLSDLILLIKSLCSKITIPGFQLDVVNSKVEDHLHPHPYLGFECETKLSSSKLSVSEVKQLRQRCVQFLLELIKQLRQRLPENIKVLQDMSLFSPGECLKPVKPPIINLAMLFVQDPSIITLIDNQWKNLHHVKWTEVTDTLKFWGEVVSYRDASGENPFSEIVKIAVSILSFPHSNADVERVFSQVNIVKSKQRNRLKVRTLHSILAIRFGLMNAGKCCCNYDLPKDVVDKIASLQSYTSQEPSSSKVNAVFLPDSDEEDDF